MGVCQKCGGSGIIRAKDGGVRKCDCLIKKHLNQFLPTKLLKYKVNKKLLFKNITANVVLTAPRNESLSLIKTFVVTKFIETNGEFSFIMESPEEIMENTIFNDEEFISKYWKCDFLVLDLNTATKNKLYPEIMNTILFERSERDKQMWIYAQNFFDKEGAKKYKDFYGETFYFEVLKNFKRWSGGYK